jgi:hypothetical protein
VKVGRLHLVLSLLMLGAAISYNVWSLTRPSSTTSAVRGAAPVDALPVPAVAPTASVDPTQVAPPADVAADRAPEWAHDPFSNAFERKPAAQAAASAPAPEPEPEVTVASILYGDERRLAIVNGRIVRVGDKIGESSVIEIAPRAVTLAGGPRGRRTVSLRAPGAPKTAR